MTLNTIRPKGLFDLELNVQSLKRYFFVMLLVDMVTFAYGLMTYKFIFFILCMSDFYILF